MPRYDASRRSASCEAVLLAAHTPLPFNTNSLCDLFFFSPLFPFQNSAQTEDRRLRISPFLILTAGGTFQLVFSQRAARPSSASPAYSYLYRLSADSHPLRCAPFLSGVSVPFKTGRRISESVFGSPSLFISLWPTALPSFSVRSSSQERDPSFFLLLRDFGGLVVTSPSSPVSPVLEYLAFVFVPPCSRGSSEVVCLFAMKASRAPGREVFGRLCNTLLSASITFRVARKCTRHVDTLSLGVSLSSPVLIRAAALQTTEEYSISTRVRDSMASLSLVVWK